MASKTTDLSTRTPVRGKTHPSAKPPEKPVAAARPTPGTLPGLDGRHRLLEKGPGGSKPYPGSESAQPPRVPAGMRQLQDEVRLLRVSVSQQAHIIRALQQSLRVTAPAEGGTTVSHERRAPDPESGDSRAARALAEMQARMGGLTAEGAHLDADLERGSELVKASWIRDGLLVGSVAFGLSWSRTRQALEQACGRGELFSLKIGNKRWYPASLLGLPAEDVKAVCLLLRGVDVVSQFIFWQRKHGSLDGQTLAEALQAGKTAAVLRAAEVFASEHAEHAALA